MEQASEAILSLKPVTFHYKSDSTRTPQFGLIAEEVAKVNPDLVVRDENGEVYTVRYDAVNAMLLNEFLKEHRKVEKLEATIAQQRKDFEATTAQQQKRMEALTARLEEQAAQIQKVSAQLDVSKTAPQIVLNNQSQVKVISASLGFEPRQRDPESLVLPLHHEATSEKIKADLPCCKSSRIRIRARDSKL
jgi:septal ring factor EnvC (AmiA/AmiB activator)